MDDQRFQQSFIRSKPEHKSQDRINKKKNILKKGKKKIQVIINETQILNETH